MTVVTSILTGGVNNHETTSEEANAVYTDFVSEGIVGTVGNTSGVAPATGGLAVNAQGTPDMTVEVGTGVAYVTGTPSSQNSQTFRVKITAAEDVTISANSSGSTKYDWLYVKLDATNLNAPNTAGDNVATLVTSRSSSAASDDGTPPTYGYPLAVVTVANGASTITNGNIRDVRTQVALNTGSSNATDGWTALTTPVSVSTGYNKGNREYDLTFSSSMAAVLSPGMRFKLTRGTTPPTQCTDLEQSSSQYATVASPTGISFTTTFTCEAWVKLESYGSYSGIINRRNASTEGWTFGVNTDGSLQLIGLRIASNNKSISSYQSVPLDRWVHVAATLDMAVGDTSAQKIWIDGVEVPRSYTLNGTATALVQGTSNMAVGSERAGGTGPFDGKLDDVRLWSDQRTTTEIQDNMNQQLVGNESGLVGYWKLNGDFNDSTANANNLTGQAGAVATNADNPMNATEYAVVTKVATTTVTVFTGTGYNIPNMTLSTPHYSTQKSPFGFPASKGKWFVETISYQLSAITIGTSYAAPSGLEKLITPTGAWQLIFDSLIRIDSTATSTRSAVITLSSDGSRETNPKITVSANHDGEAASSANAFTMAHAEDFIDVSSQTTFTLLAKVPTTANTNTANIDGSIGGPIQIRAECAYI